MSLYFKYFYIHFKSVLEYRVSFILASLSQIVVFFSYYFTILCLFNSFSNIKGFTLYDVLLTFSIIQFGFSICETFFRGIDQFDDLIIDGSFDKILLRPRNAILQVCCEQIDFVRISKIIQALIVLIIALINIDVSWNITKIITLVLMLLGSVFLFLSIFIFSATYCFYTVKGLEVRNIFTDGGKHMAKYPIGIFQKGFVVVLTFIVPFGCVNYYPLLYLLDRSNSLLFMFCPLFVILYLLLSIIIFYKGMKKYTSTGS